MSRLLITGGTGSFGSAAVGKFLADDRFSEIIIFSRDEKKQLEMQQRFPNPKVTYIIGDVRFEDSVRQATRGVDLIFHAAALKHVPVGEYFPMEFIRTNLLGTENVLNAAEANGVKKVVLLSTDKAAYPINTLGLSKALAEKLIGAHARTSKDTIFCSLRYGNVMASRGSVIPLFVDCIKAGEAIPVTDPSMTRFLLSLDDAIGLVEVAIQEGQQGDLFIRKAPAATIGDLAQALLNIFGVSNKLKIVGIRPGEKIHETIATQLELARAENIGDYYRIRENMNTSKYEEFYHQGVTDHESGDYTSENTRRLSVPEIETLLLSLDYIKRELAAHKAA